MPTEPAESNDRLLDQLDQLDTRLRELEARKLDLSTRISHEKGKRAQQENDGRDPGNIPQGDMDAVRARLVALYKFKQIGYAIPLLSAGELNTALKAMDLTATLFRNDQQLFLGLQARKDQARNQAPVAPREQRELEEWNFQLTRVEKELISAQKEKLGILEQVRRQESLYARYNAKIEEHQSLLQKRALSRKPIFEFQGKPLSTRQGSLPLPTMGEITETSGSKMQAPFRSSLYNGGILIAAPKGQQIQAIHAGMVVFADWFKEYGRVMIIDHGDHYYSLIAHTDQFFKQAGESVKEGELIAVVGDTGSLDGPKLYFEIRHHGKPVDPMEWLAVRKSPKE